jgi:hypothetical protein
METLCRLSYRGRADFPFGAGTGPPRYTLRRSQGESESDRIKVPYAVAAPAAQGELQRLMEAIGQLDDRALLNASRCFGWTRADLLVHVHLGLQEMLLGLVDPTDAEPDTDAASYWRTDPPSNDPGSDELDNIRFARLLASAYRRPTGLIGHLRPTAEGVCRAIEALSTTTPCLWVGAESPNPRRCTLLVVLHPLQVVRG